MPTITPKTALVDIILIRRKNSNHVKKETEISWPPVILENRIQNDVTPKVCPFNKIKKIKKVGGFTSFEMGVSSINLSI